VGGEGLGPAGATEAVGVTAPRPGTGVAVGEGDGVGTADGVSLGVGSDVAVGVAGSGRGDGDARRAGLNWGEGVTFCRSRFSPQDASSNVPRASRKGQRDAVTMARIIASAVRQADLPRRMGCAERRSPSWGKGEAPGACPFGRLRAGS
jgi:hypothetical protein